MTGGLQLCHLHGHCIVIIMDEEKGVWIINLRSEVPLCGSVVDFKRGARPAQSVEHGTLDLGVVSLSPTLGAEMTEK